jgi:hypothetical protein
MEHLAFDVNQHHIWAIYLDLQTHMVSYVTKEVYVATIMQMEAKCVGLTLTLTFFFTLSIWNLEGGEFDLH